MKQFYCIFKYILLPIFIIYFRFYLQIILCTLFSFLYFEQIYSYSIIFLFIFLKHQNLNFIIWMLILSVKSSLTSLCIINSKYQNILNTIKLLSLCDCLKFIHNIFSKNLSNRLFIIIKSIIIFMCFKKIKDKYGLFFISNYDFKFNIYINVLLIFISIIFVKSFINIIYIVRNLFETHVQNIFHSKIYRNEVDNIYLSCKDIDIFLPNHKHLHIRDFELSKNQILIIYGPNGVGKTTFLKILCNMYSLFKGNIKCIDTIYINMLFYGERSLKQKINNIIKNENNNTIIIFDDIIPSVIKPPMIITCINENIKDQLYYQIRANGYTPIILDLYHHNFRINDHYHLFETDYKYNCKLHNCIKIDRNVFFIMHFVNINLSTGEVIFKIISNALCLYKFVYVTHDVFSVLDYGHTKYLYDYSQKIKSNLFIVN